MSRTIRTYSRVRASGFGNGCPYQPSTTCGPDTPRPRINLPPERWSMVAAVMGASEARLFVKEGAQVALADVLDADGEALATELGDGALYTHLDVTSEDEWSHAVDDTLQRFGRIDVLVNNAGILRFAAI